MDIVKQIVDDKRHISGLQIFAILMGAVLLVNGLVWMFLGGGIMSIGLAVGGCGWFLGAVALDSNSRKDLFGSRYE